MKNWKRSFPIKYRNPLFLGLGILFCLVSILLSLGLGSSELTLGDMLRAFGDRTSYGGRILWYVRIPRTLASFCSGAALAVAGGVLQGVLANSLASPNIIGVNAGAGFGVTVCCALGIASGWMLSLGAFLGSLGAVLMIRFMAVKTGASRSTVVLTGVALNSVLNAATESVAVLNKDVAALNAEFRVGGFSAVTYPRLIPAVVLIMIALAVVFSLSVELDVLLLGDETARGLGLPVGKLRILFLILAALLAGASVSFAGLLGFVGLMTPHVIRSLVGNESRWLLPLSALYGGAFVTICDLGARVLFAPFELPVGIIMAAIGGPFFVWLLFRKKGGHSHG